MKIFFKVFFVISICVTTNGYAQLKLPVLSPKAKTIQKVGLSEITISYFRPSVKNREVFSKNGLVPYGKLWRTGANLATKISFDTKVIINGTTLDKGDYAILTKPNPKNWEVFFYPFKESGWRAYVSKEPIVKGNAKVYTVLEKTESFEIEIQNITFDGADIIFAWDTTKAKLPIRLNTKEQSLKNINAFLKGPSDFDYFNAALYLHESKSDLNQALIYIQKVTKKEDAVFFQVYREALILKDLNKKKEALTSAKRSLKLSEEIKNNDFIRLNKILIQELTK